MSENNPAVMTDFRTKKSHLSDSPDAFHDKFGNWHWSNKQRTIQCVGWETFEHTKSMKLLFL